ncbi:MAG: DUF2905 domain-containing protein [Chloroflexi bacterium]|nr:DUF2905 domain-containing protein [Chloroflexota bacterium]
MENFQGIARLLIIAGLAIAFFGGILLLAGKVPYVGKLPGDIVIKKGDITFFFPIVTFLLLSLILTIIINIVLRIINK